MSWIFQYPAEEDGGNQSSSSTSSTTSSIGKDSDFWGSDSSDSEDFKEENEVQSAYKGKCDSTYALEEALPIRSKSFVCLAEASCFSSIKEIGKTEDAYTRKRRNVLAHHLWNKNTSFPRLSDGHGISKRPISSSKSTLALGITNALSRSESIGSTNSDSSSNSRKSPDSPEPLQLRSMASHNDLVSLRFSQQNVTPRRSFSLPELRLVLAGKTTSSGCRFVHDKK
ncbi:hypothetical protein JCGZ_07591 [Jatropha curcas]|uniref:Uncharacterized protein n=1 Tax=Jatropha curcas TaxID=180498 RepID=A0A067KNZ9_JATCU|nr:hypothetical protein JCGZ_07591 [Jatropha curcas]